MQFAAGYLEIEADQILLLTERRGEHRLIPRRLVEDSHHHCRASHCGDDNLLYDGLGQLLQVDTEFHPVKQSE